MPENTQSAASPSKINYSGDQKSISSEKNSSALGRPSRASFVSTLRMRVIDNNVRGKTIDKVTADHLRASNGPIVSTYGSDFVSPGKYRPGTTVTDGKYNSATLEKAKHQSAIFESRHERTQSDNFSNSAHMYQSQGSIQAPAAYNHGAIHSPAQVHDQNIRTDADVQYIKTEEDGRSIVASKACPADPLSAEVGALIDENLEYFNHVMGNCLCGKCTCSKHRCRQAALKLRQKGPTSTTYQKDFVKHAIKDQMEPLRNDFFTTFHNNETMSMASTMKTDFKQWNVGAPPRAKEANNYQAVPFAGKSYYRSEYLNWGSNPISLEKATQPLTIIGELPFLAKTTYKDNFANWTPSQTISSKKKNEKSPLSPGIPFLGETTSMRNYKPFKVGPNLGYKKPVEQWESINSYPDQYKSTFSKDFQSPTNKTCGGHDSLANSVKKSVYFKSS